MSPSSKKSSKTSSTKKPPKTISPKSAKKTTHTTNLHLIEKRRHPRFILSHEVFRETKSGKIFPVYDLSFGGLSVKVEDKSWKPGMIIQGVLNLHVDSIEVAPRLIDFYGDRAALKLEKVTTYARDVLAKALSAKRLGMSLLQVKEKLPVADYWYHGACNTDLLIRLNTSGRIARVELFFANYYWSWDEQTSRPRTGIFQSYGEKESVEDVLLADEPIKLESIGLNIDVTIDEAKIRWAKGILDAAPLDAKLKNFILEKIETGVVDG